MLLVTNANLITVAPGDPDVVPEGWMLVDDDGVIVSTGSGTPPTAEAEVLDAAGAFVAPGFVSSHSHLFTSATRGLGVDQTLYGWCDSMLGFFNHTSPEQMYWSTVHGALDFLGNGVTTAFDFTNPRLPWETMIQGQRSGVGEVRPLEYLTRQADAKADAGIRYVNALPMDVTVGTDEEIFERLAAAVAHDAAADTLGSAQVLGIDDRVGSLEPGKFADFLVVDPRSPDIGPLWHPVDNYVLACGARNLKRVYVGGRLVNEAGVPTSPLAAEASARLHEQLPALAVRVGWPA